MNHSRVACGQGNLPYPAKSWGDQSSRALLGEPGMLLASATQKVGTWERPQLNLFVSAQKSHAAIFITHRGTLILAQAQWTVYLHPELATSASAASFNSLTIFANRLLFPLAKVKL